MSYTTVGARFDGTNDYLERAGLVGAADGRGFALSFWINFHLAGSQKIFQNDQGWLEIRRHTTGEIQVFVYSNAWLELSGRSATAPSDNTWHHVLVSADTNHAAGAKILQIYIDDASNLSTPITDGAAAFDIDLTADFWEVGASGTHTGRLNADLAELWFHTQFIDFSVVANRRKFRDAGGGVVDLGSNGQTPLAAAPLVYLRGGAAGFATNLGSGGAFTLVGALTDSATNPQAGTGSSTMLPPLFSPIDTFYVPVVTGGVRNLQPALFVSSDVFYAPRVGGIFVPIDDSWKLIFDDEFSASTLNTTRWWPNWFGATQSTITAPANTAETAAYDPALVTVSNGTLHLGCVASPITIAGHTYPNRCGFIYSNGRYQFSYGYIEARIYCPGTNGLMANWPIFWTNGQNWPTDGENDIMEGLGGHPAYHYHYDRGDGQEQSPAPGDTVAGNFTGWHIYAALWQPGQIDYYYDGVLVGTIAVGITGSPQYIILGFTIGSYGGPALIPSEMLVDYVHVYSNAANAVAVTPDSNYGGPGDNRTPPLGTPNLIAPGQYAPADTFYAPAVTRGARALTPALYVPGDTFYAPSVTKPGQLAPAYYAPGDIFFAPAFNAPKKTLIPSLYQPGDAIYVPTVLRAGGAGLKYAAFAQSTDEAAIVLITITHPSLTDPSALRFARNAVDITSRGEIYLGYPFDIELPWQDSDRPPKSTLTIDNVDRQIVETLRAITGPPTVVLEVVLSSNLDVVEAGPFQFMLRNATYDILQVQGELAFLDVLSRRFPKGSFTAQSHPGLF